MMMCVIRTFFVKLTHHDLLLFHAIPTFKVKLGYHNLLLIHVISTLCKISPS
jgi:hypothetical protein